MRRLQRYYAYTPSFLPAFLLAGYRVRIAYARDGCSASGHHSDGDLPVRCNAVIALADGLGEELTSAKNGALFVFAFSRTGVAKLCSTT